MLCTRCGEVIRPVVALDIDGTLGDYHGHFIDFANEYLDVSASGMYNGAIPFKQWFMGDTGCTEADWYAAKLAYRQGGMKRSMPIYPGATTLAQEIRRHAELWVTTTRPYLSLDNIVPDTVEWLRRNEIEYDGMLFDEDKYSQLVQRVDPDRIVAVIDDLPEMCEAANEAVGRQVAILAGTRYNSVHFTYRSNLWDIAAGIGLVLHEWREQWQPVT